MEVVNNPDGKPFIVDTEDQHKHGYGHYGTSAFEQNSRFAAAQAGTAKDVAVLSRDVVISEGRIAVQLGTITKDVALLNRDLALTEARLTLVAAQNAAQAAECG